MINLLPWRIDFNKRKRRDFVLGVGITILFVFVVILIWHVSLDKQIKNQHFKHKQLNSELKSSQRQYSQAIIEQKKYKLLLSRLQNIVTLQHEQQRIGILQELASNIPASIHLLTIKKEANLVTIEGIARNHQNITDFIAKLKQSKLVTQIKLQEITTGKNINFALEAI